MGVCLGKLIKGIDEKAGPELVKSVRKPYGSVGLYFSFCSLNLI